ncbi:MATE family efflux transporter, partial [Paracoccaceae bacterium]|nr:MATE family efflux transporter [Paracoccaceae bacterium]
SRDMRNMMAVSLSVYALAVVLLVPAFGLSGLWGALLISFVIRAFSLAWRYPALEARLT